MLFSDHNLICANQILWVWPVFTPFDELFQFPYRKVEGKALKLFAKEVFMIEPFKVRGFIVTQKKNI